MTPSGSLGEDDGDGGGSGMLRDGGPPIVSGEIAGAHEIFIAGAGGAATFIEGPNDKALAAAAVAGGEHVREAGGVFAVVGLHVSAGVALDIEGIEERLLGAEKAHGEEDELGGDDAFGAGDI